MKTDVAASLNVQMLLTDGFGNVGGIAKFNRDFLNALDACPLVQKVLALPRTAPRDIHDGIPEAIVYDRKAGAGKPAFVWRALARSRHTRAINLVVCGHLNLLPVAWLSARLSGARLAVVVHGIDARYRGPIRSFIVRLLARRVDAIIAVSDYTAGKFAAWSHVSRDRVTILPNCVDLGLFKPQQRDTGLLERYGLNACKIVMTLGRLDARERYKGVDEVIDILPRLLLSVPSAKYLIVGDGSDRARLETKVKASGLAGRVVFAGQVSEAEKIALYSLAHAYVMPSSAEGFGIALIEAAACGLPVIGSAIDGSREALMNGKLGKLVDPGHSHELLGAIIAILTQKKPVCRSRDVEFFSTENFVLRVDAWLRTMMERAALQPR